MPVVREGRLAAQRSDGRAAGRPRVGDMANSADLVYQIRTHLLYDWSRWANNRVTHMYRREHFRAPWPEGITNDQQNRLRLMADAVLTRLEGGGRSIPDGRIKEAFDPLLAAARSYLSDPTEANPLSSAVALRRQQR